MLKDSILIAPFAEYIKADKLSHINGLRQYINRAYKTKDFHVKYVPYNSVPIADNELNNKYYHTLGKDGIIRRHDKINSMQVIDKYGNIQKDFADTGRTWLASRLDSLKNNCSDKSFKGNLLVKWKSLALKMKSYLFNQINLLPENMITALKAAEKMAIK